jgi:hypothetical protein
MQRVQPRNSTLRYVAAWVLVLSGCAAGKVAHEVRYTGALPGCGLTAATLTRLASGFSFTPGDGVLTIQGTVAADGSFAGTLNTQPPTKPPFPLTVRGQFEGERATLDYSTPRCHDSATLARVHPPLL